MLWTGMHSTLAAHTFIREHHCTSTLQSQRSKFTSEMAEADWDEVTYLRKKPQRAADAKSQKVPRDPHAHACTLPSQQRVSRHLSN